MKEVKTSKFLVQLIQLTLAIEELFRMVQVISYCFEVPTSIYYIAYGCYIFVSENYRGRMDLDLSFGCLCSSL